MAAAELLEVLTLVDQLLLVRAKRDVATFIDQFCKMHDVDDPTPMPFRLWDGQRKTLIAFEEHRLNVVLKARQLGLTWLALCYALHRMLNHPGYTVVGLSKREDDAKELVRRLKFVLEHLPEQFCVPGTQAMADEMGVATWEATVLTVTVHHPGGIEAVFKGMAAAEDSGRSFTASLVLIDEWAFQQWAREIWAAAYPTIHRPTGGQVIGLSTGRKGTLFEEIWSGAQSGTNGFYPTFLPWSADPRRDEAWYEEAKRNLPNSYHAEYPASPGEAFTVGEGAFFPEWREDVHVIEHWTPPRHWKRVRAYDAGYSTFACCKWYALSPDGWAVAYREYYPHRVIDRDQAREIVRLSVHPDGTPEAIEYTVADPSAWSKKSSTGESTAEVFAANGVVLQPGDNDLTQGWRRLHEWLRPFVGADGQATAMLRFTRACGNSLRTYPACMEKRTNPEDISDQSEHHPQDVDRYFVMSRPLAHGAHLPLAPSVSKVVDAMGHEMDEDRDADRLFGAAPRGVEWE